MNKSAKKSEHRQFYQLPANAESCRTQETAAENAEKLKEYINNNIIGKAATFSSPFGERRVVYCDYTASGRSLSFIEEYLAKEVLPFYGNTHTTTSVTSLQTTLYRHEARDIIRNAVNAGERDAVIFTGSGCTGAVHKLISALGNIQDAAVVVGPLEHHSNLLPWREAAGKVINIGSDNSGRTDLGHLEAELQILQGEAGRRIIGCFSKASNVTGVIEDDLSITALLHKYGALAFWDYATAAPYLNIDMNPKVPEDPNGSCYKDAVYFSLHKFVGGVQTPGILVAKKSVFKSRTPNGHGGGSVFFVTDSDHRYVKEVEVREEGGTPAITEAIRGGLVMKLKLAVGQQFIQHRQQEIRSRALQQWGKIENLVLLGGGEIQPALPIFSFIIRHPGTGLYLHHNFTVALLNDLFGIQARGGCACAGPYQQQLLGLGEQLTRSYETLLLEDERLDRVGLRRGHAEHSQWEVLRPGSTRLNLSWTASDAEVSYVLEAVQLVAEEGWRLLPLYRFNNETGDWYHNTNTKFRDRRWLGMVNFNTGCMTYPDPTSDSPPPPMDYFSSCLTAARQLFSSSQSEARRSVVPDTSSAFPAAVEELRWFVTPWEAKCCLVEQGGRKPAVPPFTPPQRQDGEANRVVADLGAILADCTIRNRNGSNNPWTTDSLTSSSTVGVREDHKVSSSGRDNSVMNEEQIRRTACAETLISNEKPQAVTATLQNSHNGIDHTPFDKSTVISNVAVSALDAIVQEDTNKTPCEEGLCLLPDGKRDTPAPFLTSSCNSARWRVPSKEIFKPFLEAVTEFGMIESGDKVMVCLSGGKDSLSLLHTVRQYQFYARSQGVEFKLGAVTVDPLSSAYDPRPLVPYLKQLGVEYLYEEQDIMRMAQDAGASSICAYCSRMKRGRIYAAARRAGYNVLALGQHLDDLSESFFMSIFHNGRLRTMKANYRNAEGDLRIIRPLVYVREKHLRAFAESQKLPIIAENCPACFEAPKERQRIKQLLAQQELLFPRLYWNLKTAMYPMMKIDRTGLESVLFGRAGEEGPEQEETEPDF